MTRILPEISDPQSSHASSTEAARASVSDTTLGQDRRKATLWDHVTALLRAPGPRTGSTRRISPLRGLVAGVIVAWSTGAVLFLLADGSTRWQLPRTSQTPTGEHNLALFRWGPTLRASSYHREWFSQHHPIFLIDGRAAPRKLEKWTSQPNDNRPWVEITWRERRRLARVVIFHGGFREEASFTARHYRLWCIDEDGSRASALEVTNNQEVVTVHPLACNRARGLRVEFTRNGPEEQVRVYEIEVWGQ